MVLMTGWTSTSSNGSTYTLPMVSAWPSSFTMRGKFSSTADFESSLITLAASSEDENTRSETTCENGCRSAHGREFDWGSRLKLSERVKTFVVAKPQGDAHRSHARSMIA